MRGLLSRGFTAACVSGPDLATWDFRERVYSTVAFRTGVMIPNFEHQEDILEFIDSRDTGHLVARRGSEDMELGPHEHRFTHLKTWSIGRRTYDLYRFTR